VSTNGVLQEGCTASNDTVNNLRQAAAATCDWPGPHRGKCVFECHTDGTESDLAAFLAGAGEGAYFGFGSWMTPEGGAPVAAAWLPEYVCGFPCLLLLRPELCSTRVLLQ
jgi:hypothetical protein